MAHSSRTKKSPGVFTSGAQFVNISLPKDVTASIKASAFSIEDFEKSMSSLMTDGYKLSVRWDKFNDCYGAWLIAPDDSENKGYILPGRGSTPMRAIKQVVYIHYIVLECSWVDDQGLKAVVLDD